MTSRPGPELRAKWGRPESFDRAAALALCGIEAQGRDSDFFAYLYSSLEMAEDFAATAREHYGHDWHGPVQVEGGWVGVVDIRLMRDRIEGKRTA